MRLPRSGDAPETAASCREVIVVMRHRMRAFVERVLTDLAVLEPAPSARELSILRGMRTVGS